MKMMRVFFCCCEMSSVSIGPFFLDSRQSASFSSPRVPIFTANRRLAVVVNKRQGIVGKRIALHGYSIKAFQKYLRVTRIKT